MPKHSLTQTNIETQSEDTLTTASGEDNVSAHEHNETRRTKETLWPVNGW